MSRDNVELVLRVLGQGRRNPTALFDALDDEVQWDVGFLDIPDSAGQWHGPAAVREFFRRWVGAFDEWDFEVGNVIDAHDSVVARVHQWGRGKGSGVSVDSEFWQVWTIRNGKVIRFRAYATEHEALEALGLREWPMSQENAETAAWIETLQRGIDAWNRQDLEAFLETWHPECEWRPAFPRSLEGVGTVYRGHDGIARAWHGVRAVWDEYVLEPEDARVVGDRLVAVGHVHAHGRESGLDLDSGWSALITIRDGLALSAFDWLDRDAALEVVGLRE